MSEKKFGEKGRRDVARKGAYFDDCCNEWKFYPPFGKPTFRASWNLMHFSIPYRLSPIATLFFFLFLFHKIYLFA